MWGWGLIHQHTAQHRAATRVPIGVPYPSSVIGSEGMQTHTLGMKEARPVAGLDQGQESEVARDEPG
jgi:hypothetical protein